MFLNPPCGLTHTFLLALLFFHQYFAVTSAYYVVANSNCTSFCKEGSLEPTAFSNNASCTDLEYNVTYTGVTFRQCVSCELNSDAVDPQTGQTNLGWAFYNMRFTINQCLFNRSASATPAPADQCVSRCAPIKEQIGINLNRPNATTPLDYCTDPSFVQNAQECAQCYRVISNQVYISNFLNTLATACRPVSSPFPVESSEVFTTNPPKNFSHVESSRDDSGGGGLSPKTKVAIAIAVPVVAFLIGSFIILLCWVHYRAPKKRPKPNRASRPPRERTRPSTFQDSSEAHRNHYRSGRGRRSTDSDESGRIRISPFPARRPDERVAVPPAIRVQRTPTSRADLESGLNPEDQKLKSRNSYFQGRYDVQVPNTTPNEDRSEEDYHDYMRKTSHSPEVYPLSDHPAFAREERLKSAQQPRHIGKSSLLPLKNSGKRIPKLKYRIAAPTSAYSPSKASQHLSLNSEAENEPTTSKGITAETVPPIRRLLSGSPFAAPSLATLTEENQSIAQSRKSRSIRTHAHTPSASSRKQDSSSTQTGAPTPSPHHAQSVTDKGAEKVNDPALTRAMAATPPLQRVTTLSASDEATTSNPLGSKVGGMDDSGPSESLSASTLVKPAAKRPLSPEMYFPIEATREKVNDPALKRAMRRTSSLPKTEAQGPPPEPPTGLEPPKSREKVNDPALARAMTASSQYDTLQHIVTSISPPPSPDKPVLKEPMIFTLPSDTTQRSEKSDPSVPSHDKPTVRERIITTVKEKILDPAFTRSKPRTPSPTRPATSRVPEKPAFTGTPQWEDISRQSHFNRLERAGTESPSSQISPMTTPMLVQSSSKQESRPERNKDARSKRPSTPISPGTVPTNSQLETVSEEPRKRPTSPVRLESTPDEPGASSDYLTAPLQYKSKRPSSPVSPGTVPEAAQLNPVQDEPAQRPEIRRRPTSPVSPGIVPQNSKVQTDYLTAPVQSQRKRPSTPISPGTLPTTSQEDPAREPPTQKLSTPITSTTQPPERPANPTPSASPTKSRSRRTKRPSPSVSPRTTLIPTSAYSTAAITNPPTPQYSPPGLFPPSSDRRPTSPISPRTAYTASRFQDPRRSPSIDSSLLLSSMGGSSQDTQASSSAGLGMGAALTATTVRAGVVVRGVVNPPPAASGQGVGYSARAAGQGVRWAGRGEGGSEGSKGTGTGTESESRSQSERDEGVFLGRPRPDSRGRRLGERVYARWREERGL